MRRSVPAVLAVLLALPLAAQRLPGNTIPSNYKLRFVPDLAAETFTGEETISVTLAQPARTIVLHAAELQLSDATITAGGETQKAIVSFDAAQELAGLTVARPIPAGPASISIRFRGILNDKLRGFYISKSERRKYAVTQFEPTDARRAFPSFDEPAMKATYDVTIVADKGDHPISNSKVASDTPGPGANKHTVTFERTAKMSTYLVALLVGDWACSEGSADGIPIRVCALPEKKELTTWGVTTAEAEISFYNEYYGFKYPFGKLDIIAFPDFEAGAMENAGAITFRETALLVDDRNASATARRDVASTNSHEIAHMWFGDTVTMKWWNDIWLNEGFATWITPKPLAAWKPEWNVRVEEAAATSHSLAVDSQESTRPIRARADTPGEINQMFDGIAYGKTAAVLRMLESYVGEEPFREGIRAYINKYAFANAQAEDFWGTMTSVTGQPVDRIMPTFVVQAGAPLVSATSRCDNGQTLLTLSQRRMSGRRSSFVAGSPQLWTIPVTTRNLDAPESAAQKFLLSGREQTFRFDGCAPHQFINRDARGYYRTSHAEGMIDPSADLLKVMTPSERVALLTDSWALVEIGEVDVARQLALIDRLRGDRERAVVNTIVDELGAIDATLVSDAQRPSFQRWVAAYARPILADVGWTGAADESDEQKRLRSSIIYTLGYVARDEETLRHARELTLQELAKPNSVEGTLVDTVVALAAAGGDAALFDRMERAMKSTPSPQAHRRYQNSLPAFTDPALQRRAFALAIAPEMRNQDLPGYVRTMLAYPTSREAAWSYLKSNWSELQKKFTVWGAAGVVAAAGSLCDPKQRADVAQFFAEHPVPASERSLSTALESIDACIEFRNLQTQNFNAWLTAQPSAGTSE